VTEARGFLFLALIGYAMIKGDSRRAAESFHTALAFHKERGSIPIEAWARLWRVKFVYVPLGEWAKAKEELAEISRVRVVQTLPPLRGELFSTLGTLHFLEGELDKAEEYLKEAYSILVPKYNWITWYFGSYCHVSLGRLSLAKGESRHAENYLKEVHRLIKGRGQMVDSAQHFTVCVSLLVDACLLQGKTTEAHRYLEELQIIANLANTDWADAYYSRAAGAVASDAEDWGKAREFYERSVECFKRLEWPYEVAITYQRLAVVHQEKGETESANQFLDRALDLFKGLGADLDVKNILSAKALSEEHQDALSVLRLSRSGSERSHIVFSYLTDAFITDYFTKRYSSEDCGWRSLIEIAHSTKIPVYTFYQADPSQSGLPELKRSGLIETRLFLHRRGRGGKITRVRIAFEREEIKHFISRKAGKKSRGLMAPSA
jgi:tetratricopeptide (TPR) repeat protein